MSNDTHTPTIDDVLTLVDGTTYKVVSVYGSRILADPLSHPVVMPDDDEDSPEN